MKQEEARRRYRMRAILGALIGFSAFAVATAIPILFPSTRGFFTSLNTPGVYLLLMAAYTVMPFMRDHHEPLVFWPAVMFGLGGMVIVLGLPLLGMPTTGDLPMLSLYPLLILTAIALLWASVIMMVVAFLVSYRKEPIQLVHPVLRAAMQGTQASPDYPMPIEIPLGPQSFPDPARFASFLRQRKLVAMAHVRRGHLTVRIARVQGLPHSWTVLLLPFGQTVLRVDSRGVARISVDSHTYRILGRPGPYPAYCRNIAEAFSHIAVSVAHGTYREATRSAAA